MAVDELANQAEVRYRLVPQMRDYDGIRQHLLPYLCQGNQPHLKTKVVETDALGFRVSYWGDRRIETSNWGSFDRKAIILGGSVAFGWGSTSDRTALASQLSDALDIPTLSLGIMAGNSLMEFIAAAPYYGEADLVISVTCNNTLYTCMEATPGLFDLYEPLYPFNSQLYHAMRQYDILTSNFLLSDSVDPNRYFKNSQQRQLFKDTMRERFWRRLLFRIFKKAPQEAPQAPKRSIREGLDLAVKMVCRDIHNTCRAAGGARHYLAVLQPFAPSLDRELPEEESIIKEVQRKLSRPDIFDCLYGPFREVYSEYISRVAQYCKENTIPYIDAHHSSYPGWCFVDSSHLSDRGTAVLVEAIRSKLIDQKSQTHKSGLSEVSIHG